MHGDNCDEELLRVSKKADSVRGSTLLVWDDIIKEKGRQKKKDSCAFWVKMQKARKLSNMLVKSLKMLRERKANIMFEGDHYFFHPFHRTPGELAFL